MQNPTEEAYGLYEYLFTRGYSLRRFAEEFGHPLGSVYRAVPRFYKTGAIPRRPRQRMVMRDLQKLLDRLEAEDDTAELAAV